MSKTLHPRRGTRYPSYRYGDKQCGTVELPNGALLAVSYGTIVGYVPDHHADSAVWTAEKHSLTTTRHEKDLYWALSRPVNTWLPAEEFAAALGRDTGQSAAWGAAPVHFTK